MAWVPPGGEQSAGDGVDPPRPPVVVSGSPVTHFDGGSGPTVLFLHGWALGPGAYREPLRRLAAAGCRVLCPAQPGFAGTPELPAADRHFEGYAAWAARYLDAVGVDGEVVVAGHSFGGGVAIRFAHDHPGRVRAAVLCNAVGGPALVGVDGPLPMAKRSLWEWGQRFGADLLAPGAAPRVWPAVLPVAAANLVVNPMAVWRVASFVRRADLLDELAVVGRRRLPVSVVWSDRDRLVPRSGYSAMVEAADALGVTVPGHHNWLIAEPDRFVDLMLQAVAACGALEETLAVG